MTLPLKTTILIATSLFFGATVWLWIQAGPQVFVTYAQSVAKWCF